MIRRIEWEFEANDQRHCRVLCLHYRAMQCSTLNACAGTWENQRPRPTIARAAKKPIAEFARHRCSSRVNCGQRRRPLIHIPSTSTSYRFAGRWVGNAGRRSPVIGCHSKAGRRSCAPRAKFLGGGIPLISLGGFRWQASPTLTHPMIIKELHPGGNFRTGPKFQQQVRNRSTMISSTWAGSRFHQLWAEKISTSHRPR